MLDKPILALDFDGVIHSYESNWVDDLTILDSVTDGFFEWSEKAAKFFRLVIYSSRSKNPIAITAMREWLAAERKKWIVKGSKNAIDSPLEFEFASEKPAAFITIDDRALMFTGNWSNFQPEELIRFKPWNKKLISYVHK